MAATPPPVAFPEPRPVRMPPRRACGWWVQACAILVLATGMSLALGSAAVRLGLRLFREDHALGILAGMALYGLAAGGAAWLLRCACRRLSPVRFALATVSVYFLVQVILVFSGGSRLAWTGDSRLLQQHIEYLSAEGYSVETLAPISDTYDYQVWARRALPFYFLIHRAAGAAFPAAVQCFQALVMALTALLTWRLASLLLGFRAAAIALAFHVLMPWRIFTHLDLAHHILGSFYYTVGTWILVEWHQPAATRRIQAGLLAAAAALLPLMHLEGGIDFVYVAAVAATLLLAWFMGSTSARGTLKSAAALLVLPLVSTAVCTGPLDKLLDRADRHHYDSGILAWSTRGWSLETGGQYCGTYEQLDILTPRDAKKSMLLQILASQVRYNPAAVAFRQLPTKAAKYFMAGFASGFEEVLKHNERHTLRLLYIGARNAYLLILLPLAIGGGFFFLAWFRGRDGLFFVLPMAIIAGAYVVFGESDPRYSVYLHSYYFLAAGACAAWLFGPAAERPLAAPEILRRVPVPAATLAAVFAAWCAGIFALSPRLDGRAFWNLRQASVTGNTPQPLPAILEPFEIRLPPVPDTGSWGVVRLPARLEDSAALSFYLLPQAGLSASRGYPVRIRRAAAQGAEEIPLALPARVELAWRPGDPKSFEILAEDSPAPFPLLLGYANLRTAP